MHPYRFSSNSIVLFCYFSHRAHGHDCCSSSMWPDYNNSGDGLNMLSPDGNTPTGLMEFDLNTPEPDPKSYGPYPVNRAVNGLKGNAAFLIPNIRNGILMHTGEHRASLRFILQSCRSSGTIIRSLTLWCLSCHEHVAFVLTRENQRPPLHRSVNTLIIISVV